MKEKSSAIIQFFGHTQPYASESGKVEFRFNSSVLYLKQYFEMYGENPDVKWLPADIIMHKTVDSVVSDLDPTTTIVGLAIFIWNEDYQYEVAKKIKEKYNHMVVVAGGPSVDVHRNDQYFIKHPYIDYAVFGDGEEAFRQIIDYETGYLTDQSGFVNIGVNTSTCENNLKLFEFKRMTDDKFFEKSIYLEQTDYVDLILKRFKEATGNQEQLFIFHTDYSRGCPYKCTFCDWNSGLHTKVKRFKKPWKDELDYFKKMDYAVQNIDANFGQWEEDIDIIEYAASLYDPNKNFRFIVENLPKLRKENQIKVINILAKVFKSEIVLSYQDLNPTVLEAIDRPSLSWSDQLDIINKVREANPDASFSPGLILGLPEQTFDIVIENIVKFAVEGKLYHRLYQNLLHFLPNSPMADPFYLRLHGLEFRKTFTVNTPKILRGEDSLLIPKSKDFNNFYRDISLKKGKYFHYFVHSTMIYKTRKMSREDIVSILVIGNMLENYCKTFDITKVKDFEKLLFSFIPKAKDYAKRIVKNDETYYDKYGVIFNFPIEEVDQGYKLHPGYIFRKNILNLQNNFGDIF